MLDKKTKYFVLLAIILHLIISVWHGDLHGKVPVPLLDYQTIFVVVVVIILPILAGILLFTRQQKMGTLIASLSIFAAFIFGVVHHFILISPDNIWHLPISDWAAAFTKSTLVLATTDAVCAIYCLIKYLKFGKV